MTVNALLPGGATETGMIPEGFPKAARASLLRPEIMVAPLLWLVSAQADGVRGKRMTASRFRSESPGDAVDDIAV